MRIRNALVNSIAALFISSATFAALHSCKGSDTLYDITVAGNKATEEKETKKETDDEKQQSKMIDQTLIEKINQFNLLKADEYINQYGQQWLEEYRTLLRFKTISGEGEDGQEKIMAVQYLKQLFEKRGFEVKLFDIEYTNNNDTPDKENKKGTYPILYLEKIVDTSLPTVLFDTHYDVRPINNNAANPWKTEAFNPIVKEVEEKFGDVMVQDKRIFARGADDSKGHIMALLIGLELYQNMYGKNLKGGFPLNIKLLLEGTEETESYAMDDFIEKNKQLLATDVVVIADAPTLRQGVPTILYGLRGYMAGEICVKTAEKDNHSGTGSYIPNAIEMLAYLVSQLQNPFTGEVSFAEFYEGMKKQTGALEERINQQYKDAPEGSEKAARQELKLKNTVGDKTKTPAVRTTIYPSLDFQKITGGGEGIIPSFACVKYSMRLVDGQNPETIKQALEKKVQDLAVVEYAEVMFHYQKAGSAFFTNPDSVYQQIASAVLRKIFGSKEIDMIIDGASEPIASYYQQILRKDIIFVAFGSPNDNCHAPNESMLWNHGVILGAKAVVGLINGYGK